MELDVERPGLLWGVTLRWDDDVAADGRVETLPACGAAFMGLDSGQQLKRALDRQRFEQARAERVGLGVASLTQLEVASQCSDIGCARRRGTLWRFGEPE